jgi:hypothetical protein
MFAKDNIKQLFEKSKELTIKEIVSILGISKQMAHIAINALVEEKYLEKLGRTPKTIYRLVTLRNELAHGVTKTRFTPVEEEYLKKEFLVVTESGNLLEGAEAFIYWCNQRKQPPEKTFREFQETKKRNAHYYDTAGMINGYGKLKTTKGFNQIWLDDLFYLDFYAIEHFGKTKLGTLLHYAKQGQNKMLMRIMMEMISYRIKTFIDTQGADAVGFVPPTIRREVQIMRFIQDNLNLVLPIIDIKKVSGIIPVPQKSLAKLDERIRNAENTFAITDRRTYDHIILIDDAVGSGATLNEVAGKIKSKGVARKITGLAIVGSFKGFDVITDV